MATNLNIDENLLNQALRISGKKTKRDKHRATKSELGPGWSRVGIDCKTGTAAFRGT